MAEKLEGTVENITFQNAENLFIVFRLRPLQSGGIVTAVGKMPAPYLGEQLELTGNWLEHPKFGRQFQIMSCKRVAPADVKGIERFLASGVIKGVGPSTAARIVARFGNSALEVIESAPHRLVEIEGIGAKKAEMIRSSYAEMSEIREVMLFLEMHGVSGTYGAKIYKQYGPLSLDILKDDPYRLAAEVTGIGFRTADQIAMSTGLEPDHPARIVAGIHYALLQTAQAGHCCVPEDLLVQETAKLLRIDRLEIALRLSELLKQNVLCVEDYHGVILIYPPYLYYAEKRVAERLRHLLARTGSTHADDHSAVVAHWERSAGVELAVAQREAMAAALAHGVLVLTGGPGTGKTTTVKGILAVLAEQGFKILLGAPTGRAAKRLSEATGREAVTVHRLLEAAGGGDGVLAFARDEDNPLEADAIILDEVSMMDISLMNSLLRAVPDGCKVILVGDVDQLPAVGPGSVLKDMIRSAVVPVVRLTEVFRQAAESPIVANAHRINRGLQTLFKEPDFVFQPISSPEDTAQAIVKLCVEALPAAGFDALADVQVLSPMHRLECGVENLNKLLQQALNPEEEGKVSISGVNMVFREGDKVMQIRNNYNKGVFNGDIGYIRYIDDGRVGVCFPDCDAVYERAELDELHLAYAMSVHKSQGSEYPVVIMPLTAGHHIMLQRNLLYTAVTRAKERVILLGTKAALNTALGNDRTKRRYSLLAERLRGDSLC
jgi:exodeoxyribonuclease V alpha subunit